MKAADLPLQYNAINILEHNLSTRPDKVALLSVDRELTFRQVSDEVNQVGNALKKLDVRRGEMVGILAPNCPEWVTSFFGLVKIGAVAVAMNALSKSHEHAYILRDTHMRVLIVHKLVLPNLEAIRSDPDFPKHLIVIGGGGAAGDLAFTDWIEGESKELQATDTHRDDICSLNFSSGSTGEPKGIPHAHKDYPLTAQLWGVNVLGLRESDRTFGAPPLFFTFGTGGVLIFPWYVGASTIVMSAPPRVPTNLLEHIQRFKPTVFYHAPTGYAALLALEDFSEKYDIGSLRLCVSAAEALPASIWHRWKEHTGLDIIDGIGSTENFHIFLSNRPGDIRPGSSGKPFDGYELKITDDYGADVAPGHTGHLLVKGETAAPYYLHQAEKSRRTFRGEWLFTGDEYYVDEDGYYWYSGRSDDMLKVGGIWVSPVEVESTLISHPAVLESAVVGHPDTSSLVKPKAFVVLKAGQIPSEEMKTTLVNYCREKMAEYKRPRWIEFVTELPKTATGKVQRFKLREA